MRKILMNKILTVAILIILNLFITPVNAASLTSISDVMSRLTVSVDSNHTITFTTPSGVEAGRNFTIEFPSDFSTTGVDFTDIDVTDDGAQLALAASASGTTWGAVFGGTGNRTLTVTSGTGTITAASVIVVKIGTHTAEGAIGDQAINNPTTNNSYVIALTVDNVGTANDDTGKLAVAIVTNDQVVLNAVVDPSITFSLSGNSSTFTDVLSPGIVRTAASVITLTVGTNGNGGYSITVRDIGNGANPGLFNSLASSIIGSADGSYSATADLNSVQFGYGLQAACTAGCTTGTDIASDFRQGGDTVGGVTISPKTLATHATSTSTNHTITNTYKAKASASTKAGNYTDTLIYIATATF